MSIVESRNLMGLPPIKGLPNIPGNSDNLLQYMAIQSKLEDPDGNAGEQKLSLTSTTKDRPSTMDENNVEDSETNIKQQQVSLKNPNKNKPGENDNNAQQAPNQDNDEDGVATNHNVKDQQDS